MRIVSRTKHEKGISHVVVFSSLLFALLLLLAACQPVQPADSASAAPAAVEIPNVVIEASDTSYDMPDEIPAGLVSLTLKIVGESGHHAIISRLQDGVTLQQLSESLQSEEENDTSTFYGMDIFVPDTGPGQSNQATLDLPPGNYGIFSVSMEEDMVPDFAKGMLNVFTVADNGHSATTPPTADLTVTISDVDFDMPAELQAGLQTVQVTNASSADNGFVFFLKLGGDTTIDDILAMFDELFTSGTMPEEIPDFNPVGGLMTNSVSDTYWTTMNLEPGNYVAISNIGGTEFPYSGLAKNFTVQ